MKKYYRNKEDFTSPNGIFIEAGSLFIWAKGELILVDDDVYVAVAFDENSFEFAFESNAE